MSQFYHSPLHDRGEIAIERARETLAVFAPRGTEALAAEVASWAESFLREGGDPQALALDPAAVFALVKVLLCAQAQGATRLRLDEPFAAQLDLEHAEEGESRALERLPLDLMEAERARARLLAEHARKLLPIDPPPLQLHAISDPPRDEPDRDEPPALALASAKMRALEEEIARDLQALASAARAPAPAVPSLHAGALTLSPSQARAVRGASALRLACITGGPGSGKTTTLRAIVAALHRQGLAPDRVRLAAPTGRAAERMRRSLTSAGSGEALLSAPTSTLHRLLDYSPSHGRFRRDRRYPIEAEAVLIDESSMIDAPMMRALLRAIDPLRTRLYLLGDIDQLPPVGVGAPFRDLMRALPAQTFVLEGTHRIARSAKGQALLAATLATRAQTLPAADLPAITLSGAPLSGVALAERQLQDEDAPGFGVSPLSPAELESFVRAWSEALTPDPALLAPFEIQHAHVADEARAAAALATLQRARLLTTRRGTWLGSHALNTRLVAQLRQSVEPRDRAITHGGWHAPPIGAPMMVVRNDYERAVFNGDTGLLVVDPRRRAHVLLETERGLRAWPLESFGASIEPAYAITVHKSQGSEWDHIALLLPPEGTSHALLYTAITRARESALVIGAEPVVRASLQKKPRRETALAELLRAGPRAS